MNLTVVFYFRNGNTRKISLAGVRGAPTVYRTKRECVEAIERYLDILRDKMAGRL